MKIGDRSEINNVEPQLYVRFADAWIFAQVAECVGVSEADVLRRGGERFQAVLTTANNRLEAERPTVAAVLAARDTIEPDPASQVAAEYMVAECFEEFGDSQTAARVRVGGARELLVATVALALDRLARALDGVGGDEFEWEEEHYAGRDSFEDRCERYNFKLKIIVVKFFLAELLERFDADLAEELRAGSSVGSDWYWELNDETIEELARVNPEFVEQLRHPTWPSYRDVTLPDLVFAGELGCVELFAYTKLRVDDPPDRDLLKVWDRACGHLRVVLAVADQIVREEAPAHHVLN